MLIFERKKSLILVEDKNDVMSEENSEEERKITIKDVISEEDTFTDDQHNFNVVNSSIKRKSAETGSNEKRQKVEKYKDKRDASRER